MTRKKITLINIISNLILQVITIVSFFIIPKIILIYFGSEVNGLVSSINQFLNFITLIEGGITGIISANLYKPLIQNKHDEVSSIIKTADKFYKGISIIFIIYSIALACIYPLIFSTSFSYQYVFSLVIILSMNLLIQYMFAITNKTLLNADKKVYIVALSQTFMVILNIFLAFISVKIYPSIHFFKIISGLLFFLQPIIFSVYIKKNYKIDKEIPTNKDILKQRWNGFAINFAAFIHLSTDVAILTIFTDLVTVSIYSVYTLVTNGLRQILNSISNAIVPTIGQAYASGNSELIIKKMELYEYIILILVFFMFSVAGLLITPFVMIYTKGVMDGNYFQPIFGIVILIAEALYIIKYPHLNLAYSANKFKEITKPAFIEAAINIIVSIVLVLKFKMIGIAIGTLLAMLYRMISQVNFTKRIIKEYRPIEFYKKIMIFSTFTILGIVISFLIIPKIEYTIISWLWHAVAYSCIFMILYVVESYMFFKKEIVEIKNYIKH